MSRAEYIRRVESMADFLVGIDSDVLDLSRPEAKTIARHILSSEWLDRYVQERVEEGWNTGWKIEREVPDREAWLLSVRDEHREMGRIANRRDLGGAGDYDHGVAHGINIALGREGEDE